MNANGVLATVLRASGTRLAPVLVPSGHRLAPTEPAGETRSGAENALGAKHLPLSAAAIRRRLYLSGGLTPATETE